MSFYLEEEIKPDFDFDYEKVAKEVVEFCLSHENFPYEAEINLTLTDDEGIHKINKQFRNIDRATDVLSFPMLSYDAPGDFSFRGAPVLSAAQPNSVNTPMDWRMTKMEE